MTDEKIDMTVMLREGKSHGELAAHYGVTLSTVPCNEHEYEQGKILGEDLERPFLEKNSPQSLLSHQRPRLLNNFMVCTNLLRKAAADNVKGIR